MRNITLSASIELHFCVISQTNLVTWREEMESKARGGNGLFLAFLAKSTGLLWEAPLQPLCSPL